MIISKPQYEVTEEPMHAKHVDCQGNSWGAAPMLDVFPLDIASHIIHERASGLTYRPIA